MITELGLPGMSGFDLIQSVREMWPFPIMVLTHDGDIASKMDAFSAGADDYVVKGTQFEEIEARIASLLRRSTLSQSKNFSKKTGPDSSLQEAGAATTAIPTTPANSVPAHPSSHLTREYRFRPIDYKIPDGSALLVIDGSESERQRVARVIKRFRQPVIEATSGTQGLLTIAAYKPRLVLSELVFDDQDGLSMLRTLRTHPVLGRTSVIVVTNRHRPEDREAALSLGVVDYIIKPWKADELMLRVSWGLRRPIAVDSHRKSTGT